MTMQEQQISDQIDGGLDKQEQEYKTIKDANELIQKLFHSPLRTRSIPRHMIVIQTPDEMEFKAIGNTKFEAQVLACRSLLDYYNKTSRFDTHITTGRIDSDVFPNPVCPKGMVFGESWNCAEACDDCEIDYMRIYAHCRDKKQNK